MKWGRGRETAPPAPKPLPKRRREERFVMDDYEVHRLRDWAVKTIAWDKAVAKHRGKRYKYIKGGRFMQQAVKHALNTRTVDPKVRAKAAVKIIHKHVKETYDL